MSLTPEPHADSATLLADRRRPGRASSISPELIPILRGEETVALPDERLAFEEEDQLSEARGVMFGMILSAPLWLGVAFVGRWLLS